MVFDYQGKAYKLLKETPGSIELIAIGDSTIISLEKSKIIIRITRR